MLLESICRCDKWNRLITDEAVKAAPGRSSSQVKIEANIKIRSRTRSIWDRPLSVRWFPSANLSLNNLSMACIDLSYFSFHFNIAQQLINVNAVMLLSSVNDSLKDAFESDSRLTSFYYDWINSDNSQIHDTVPSAHDYTKKRTAKSDDSFTTEILRLRLFFSSQFLRSVVCERAVFDDRREWLKAQMRYKDLLQK